MSDEDEEKQHEPTQKKLEDARKKGEFPRSADLNTAAGYLGLCLCAAAFGPRLLKAVGDALMGVLDRADRLAPLFLGQGSFAAAADGLVLALMAGVGPWMLLPALLALLSILAQRSLVFTPSKLAPKLSRLSPIENAKNKFGRNGLFEFLKSAGKMFIYATVLSVFLVRRSADMLETLHFSPGMASARMLQLALEFMLLATVIALVIGGVDYFWQYFEHRRRNRMSQQDLKDEVKQAEGDPQAKQQRRQKGFEIAMNQMLAEVPTADVVVVNPTHFAVALKWDRASGSAPVCVAKGVDEIAARIRERAAEAGVPLHRDVSTARALYASVEIGQEILPEHYRPVAAAIRFAENLRKKSRGAR